MIMKLLNKSIELEIPLESDKVEEYLSECRRQIM